MEMKQKRKTVNKRKFVAVSRTIISIFQVLTFAYIWIVYYNLFAFRTHRFLGGAVSLVVYYVIYDNLARLYKAYKVGQYQIGETIFSQLLSFGFADLFLYVECCLIARNYVNIVPGAVTVIVQLAGTILWAVLAKNFYMRYVPAPKTLLIYGDNDVTVFTEKLERKYKHLFSIERILSAADSREKIREALKKAEIVVLYNISHSKRIEIMRWCVSNRKIFYVTPEISDIVMEGFENRHIIDTPLMKYESNRESLGRAFSKRLMDIIISLFGLTITLPLSLIAMLAIKIEDGGAIFFRQERYTKDWKKFNILKFRSMVMDAEKDGAIPCRKNDNRITKVGEKLRRFRIDEIPQLINVLKGDMSLVGPRPERVENVEKYTEELPEFAYRLRVKGGLTGYAQLYGKYNTSALDKLKMDLMYIENQSFIMDLKMIMLTLKIIFVPESTEGFSEDRAEELNTEKEVFCGKAKGIL